MIAFTILKFTDHVDEPAIYIAIVMAVASLMTYFRRTKIPKNKLLDLASNNDLEGFKKEMNKKKVDVNEINLNRTTPLIAATIKFGRKYIIEALIEKGAMVDWQDINGNTALHYAVIGNNKTAVKTLLQHHANFEIKNDEKKTARDLASEKGTAMLKMFE